MREIEKEASEIAHNAAKGMEGEGDLAEQARRGERPLVVQKKRFGAFKIAPKGSVLINPHKEKREVSPSKAKEIIELMEKSNELHRQKQKLLKEAWEGAD